MIPDNQKTSFTDKLFASSAIIVLIKDGKKADIGGNAVVIAPFIAITATHIIQKNKFISPLKTDFNVMDDEYHFPDLSLNIFMYSIKYKNYFLLKIKQVIPIRNSDLSILYIDEKSQNSPKDVWNDIELSLTPPRIDNHVFTIGTTIKSNSYKITTDLQSNITIDMKPEYQASFGIVRQFFDKSPTKGPGFYSNLHAPNSFSGSPVYNKNKQLIGVISSSDERDTYAPTLTSLLLPIFVKKFKIGSEEQRHIYRLAQEKIINCKALYRIKIKAENQVTYIVPKSLKN